MNPFCDIIVLSLFYVTSLFRLTSEFDGNVRGFIFCMGISVPLKTVLRVEPGGVCE